MYIKVRYVGIAVIEHIRVYIAIQAIKTWLVEDLTSDSRLNEYNLEKQISSQNIHLIILF